MRRFGYSVFSRRWEGRIRFLTVLLLVPAISFAEQEELEARVVEVMVTYQEHDPFLPWQKKRPATRRGYGVIVDNARVVTTERLIRNHTLVELRKARSGEKITATVEVTDYQVNLALLKIRDERMAAGMAPLQLTEQMPDQPDLTILQFDKTSQIQRSHAKTLRISMTKLSNAPYLSLTFSLLTDVIVNGEGAAVVYKGKLAGLIMSYARTERIGAMLPYPVLEHFLRDAGARPYRGFASAGFMWTTLVDPAKRAYLNVHPVGRGILVLSCLPNTGAFEALKPNDVILEWDKHPVDNLGFYEDGDFGRLGFPYLIKGRREPGDVVPVKIVRNRTETIVNVRLGHRSDTVSLIPENVTGEQPEYLVSGGFIIRALTGRYLRAFGPDWERTIDARLAHIYLTQKHAVEYPGDHVIILAGVLPDPINIGYQHFHNEMITSLNGKPVRNMTDVFRVVDEDGAVSRLTLQSVDVELVLDKHKLIEANTRLAKLYRIPTLSYQKPK